MKEKKVTDKEGTVIGIITTNDNSLIMEPRVVEDKISSVQVTDMAVETSSLQIKKKHIKS